MAAKILSVICFIFSSVFVLSCTVNGDIKIDLDTGDQVENISPVADAGTNQTLHPGEVVQFDGSSSYDDDGTIESYDWDFGDTFTSTLVDPTHSYVAANVYTVALTVTDDEGTTDTNEIQITIENNIAPVASVTATNAASQDALVVSTRVGNRLPITFDATSSTDSDGTIDTYHWDFGDGNTDTGSIVVYDYGRYVAPIVSEDDIVASSPYTVTLTITDNDGDSDVITFEIIIGYS